MTPNHNSTLISVQREQSEARKFASDVMWFSLAQLFVSFVLGMITLPALTKSYSSEIYGIWVQITVTVDLVSPLLSLQLGLAAVKFLAGEENRAKRSKALAAMVGAITVFASLACVTGVVFARELSMLLFNSGGLENYVILLVSWISLNSYFNFFLSYLRARGKIRQISIIQVVITAIKMAAILLLARSGFSLDAVVIAMVVLQGAFALFILVEMLREVGLGVPDLGGLRNYLAFSVPQMPVILLLWVIGLSDRYLITHFLGLSENGIYSSSGMIANLTSLFYAPVAFVLFPTLSRLWPQKRSSEMKSYFESSMRFFLSLAIPAAVGISAISQPLLGILSTSEYQVGRDLVLLLCFGAVFLGVYQINTNVILLDKQARLLPVMTSLGCVSSVLMNVLLIPKVGIMGAAVSNCCSYLLLAAVSTLMARKTVAYNLNLKYFGKIGVSAAAMLLCLSFLKTGAGWGMLLSVVSGCAVYGAGLIISRAVTAADMQVIGKAISSAVARKQT